MPALPSLELTRPLGLLLLAVLLPALVLIHRHSRAYLPPGRRVLALGIRLLVTMLLTLAVTAPTVRGSADRMAVAFLVDRSDSIAPAARAQQEEWLRKALASMAPEDRASIVVFGAEPLMERQLSADRTLGQIGSVPPGGQTNLAAAIRLGMASLPSTWARKLVILSDGNQNVGNALDEANLVHAAGVPIFVVPVSADTGNEVLVSDVQVPSVLREGETFSVTVTVESTTAAHARIHLLSDGRVVGDQEADLNPGTNSIVFAESPLDKGFHALQVQVEADNDTFPENNQGGAFVVVRGRPHVLIVEDTAGQGRFLKNALTAAGIDAEVANPGNGPLTETALRSYDSVVLVNVAASKLSDAQMHALQAYVRDYGGGLVVIGGTQSYTVGNYSRTPLEEALPVRMELQGQTASASVALVLVIDNSGSMAGGPFGASKMDLAKEAAISAAELLGEYDRLGVIAFEETPRWALEISDVTDMGRVQQEIGSMTPGGGTNIYPALDEAYRALAQLDAKVKHVILLTDGITPGANWDDLMFRYNQAHISLSTIAIGSDADFNLLKQLAEMGKGRYYEGNDPYDLPRLVVKETQQVERAAIVEQPFHPHQVSRSPMVEGFQDGQFPALRGYVSTTLKPTAQMVLTTPQGDPLLAEWQYGLGRTVAWTSDAENKWAADWVDWPEFSRFWAQVIKRTLPPPVDPNRQITVVQDGPNAHIVVDAVTEQRAFLNFAHTTASVTLPDGQQLDVPLTQSAPGRYEGQFPAKDEGAYFIEVLQRDDAGNVISSQPGGYVVPYSAEYRERQPNLSLLTNLAQLTGGATLDDPIKAFAHDQPAPGQPLEAWPTLLALAAGLFLLDVSIRRLRLAWADVRPLTRRLQRAWRQRQPGSGLVGTFRAARQHGRSTRGAALPDLKPGEASAPPPATAPPESASGRTTRLLQAKRRARAGTPPAGAPAPPDKPPR